LTNIFAVAAIAITFYVVPQAIKFFSGEKEHSAPGVAIAIAAMAIGLNNLLVSGLIGRLY
jgi:hypothetical protein